MRLTFALLTLVAVPVHAGIEFHVSPHGRENSRGGDASSATTLTHGAQLARSVRASQPAEPVTIWLADGSYILPRGLVLTAADSGTATAPVTYRASAGARPILRLGREVPASALQPVTDTAVLARVDPAARPALRQIDLRALGANEVRRFADVIRGNGGLPELFQQRERLSLSRWPNGEQGYVGIEEVRFGGGKKDGKDSGGVFIHREDRAKRWLTALAENQLWLGGFWRVPWICEAIRVQAIDPATNSITFARSVPLGIGSKYSKRVLPDGTRQGDGSEKWYAFNLIEEIDIPGEWSVDFARQTIYVWPAADPTLHPLFLSDIREPMITLRDAQHVRFIGVAFDGGADDGLRIEGGSDVLIAGCTVRNVARRGIAIVDGLRHEIRSCNLSQIGLNAISVRGGDRLTLSPCDHQIINNEIHHAGRHEPTAAVILGQGESLIGGGMGVNCVGVRFAHNRIHHCPNAGVYYSGNDNLIEFNEVFRIGLNSGDLGGFYSSGGWTSRGNVVRHNFVHHSPSANAYYVDDGDSGDLITGNLAYRVMRGSLVGGGHSNIFRGNLFVECTKGGVVVDARGVARGYDMKDKRLGDDFRSIRHHQPPWSKRYPELARLLVVDPRVPSDILIEGNLFVSAPFGFIGKPGERTGITLRNNVETQSDPGLIDPSRLDFNLRPDATVLRAIPGFQPIPLAEIGLKIDEYRRQLPASSVDLLAVDTRKPGQGFDSAIDIEASNQSKR